MPTDGKYGVLLAGGGMSHQENYGPGFAADSRARIVAVTNDRDVDERRRSLDRAFAEQMGVEYLPDLGAALARADVDLVSNCAAFERRSQVGVLCAEAGKHLYIDKPPATTREEAAALVDAVSKAGVRSQMFSQIGLPWAQRARLSALAGGLGELRAVHCDLLFAKGHPGTADLARPRRETYPPERFSFPDVKREVWTTAVYSLVFLRWLTRRSFEKVFAATGNYFFAEHQQAGVEDFGALMLTLEGGLTATLSAGRIGWRSHQSYGPVQVRLVGERASAWIDAHGPRFEVAGAQPCWEAPERDPSDPMGFWRSTQDRARIRPKPEWREPPTLPALSDQSLFLDALEAGRDGEVSVADGAAAVDAMLGAYESAATGKVIRLTGA
jgi:predicted dehydrogenase